MANIRVAVRVRPFSKSELESGARNIVRTHGNSLSISNVKLEGVSEFGDSRDRVKHFTFDYCYDSTLLDRSPQADYATQELVYQDLGTEVLQAAFDGYNACLFAYGQTGSGKTYTMMGYPGEIGLTPRVCEGLFSHVDINDAPEDSVTFRVEISYMEIYNERVRDLLRNTSHSDCYKLKVREHPKDGPYVQDLSRHVVKDYEEIQALLDRGNQLRTTAATHMHEHSSRSHAIVTVCFTQAKLENDMPSETVSKIHLVDLAGSERADPGYHADYKGRITEGASINKSLNTLGNVIKALAEKSLLTWSSESMASSQSFASVAEVRVGSPQGQGSKRPRLHHIPYRDSVLTWLLKDSLGGNSKTLMIATITPASSFYNETISTLRYAQRTKSIVNKPRVNEDANVSLIRQLRQEIQRLKQMLASATMPSSRMGSLIDLFYWAGGERSLSSNSEADSSDEGCGGAVSDNDSGAVLSEKLKANEAIANQLTQSWLSKWNETQTLMQESNLSIMGLGRRTSSHGVIIDSQLPHLIGLDDDILSSGVIIFHLKEGKTLIGREDARQEQDIVLQGPGVQAEHCHLRYKGGMVTLHPHPGAQCQVNGVAVHEPTPLTQGDVLQFGKSKQFRFNHPAQAARLRQKRKSLQEGELSTCSSMTSLSDLEPARTAPLRMFNPNLESAQICLDLEHAYANEDERIQHARRELERVRREVQAREEVKQEEEERLWGEHERHRQELEAEKIRLASLQDKLLALQEEAEGRLLQQQDLFDSQAQRYKDQLRQELAALVSGRPDRRTSHSQTDPLQHATSAMQTDHGIGTGTDAATLPDPEGRTACCMAGPAGLAIRQRKESVEGKVKDLAQNELLQKFQHSETLKEMQQALEAEVQQSREELEARRRQVMEKEELYRDADASRLALIRQQNEQLEELQRQEEQLELYLEEKQDLLAVRQARPRHLRGAHSELALATSDSASGDGHLSGAAGLPRGSPLRAASEANLGVYGEADLDLEVVKSNPEQLWDLSASGESLHACSDVTSETGLAANQQRQSGVDTEQTLAWDVSQSVEPQRDEARSSDAATSGRGTSQEGRGRTRVRLGRGQARLVQSQGPGKLESVEEKKLTSLAAKVTSRLYQAPKAPAKEFLRSKREREPVSPVTPAWTSARKTPSPLLSTSKTPPPRPPGTSSSVGSLSRSPSSSTSRSPTLVRRSLVTGTASGTPVPGSGSSPETLQREKRSREEWDRPWRTRPPNPVSRSLEKMDGSLSPARLIPEAKKREDYDKPWKQSSSIKRGQEDSEAKVADPKKTRGHQGESSPDPGTKQTRVRKTKLAANNSSTPAKRSLGRDSPTEKSTRLKGTETGSRTARQKNGSPSQTHGRRVPPLGGSSDDILLTTSGPQRLRVRIRPRLGGSDNSLDRGDHSPVSQQQQQLQRLRPRSRLRHISSASSLPSVPEAAAESEADLDLAGTLTYNPAMAALVAAVPRRIKKGRSGVLPEEDERRHSEPVGDKLAAALARYTAEMEAGRGLGEAGPKRLDHEGTTSPPTQDEADSVPATPLAATTTTTATLPHINLTTPSSSSSSSSTSSTSGLEVTSSAEMTWPGARLVQSAPVSPNCDPEPSLRSYGFMQIDGSGKLEGEKLDFAVEMQQRPGDKREHEERPEDAEKTSPKRRRRKNDQNECETTRRSLEDLVSDPGKDFSIRPSSPDSSSNYSADSLDDEAEGEETKARAGRPGVGFYISGPSPFSSDLSTVGISDEASGKRVQGAAESAALALHDGGSGVGFVLHPDHVTGTLDHGSQADLAGQEAAGGRLQRDVIFNIATQHEHKSASVEVATDTVTTMDVSTSPASQATVDALTLTMSPAADVDFAPSPTISGSFIADVPGDAVTSRAGLTSPDPIELVAKTVEGLDADADRVVPARTRGLSKHVLQSAAVSVTPWLPEGGVDLGEPPSENTVVDQEDLGPVPVALPTKETAAAFSRSYGPCQDHPQPAGQPSSLTGAQRLVEGSELSDDEEERAVEEQIQVWQEMLQQLSPRASGGNGTLPANGRRGKRRPHSRQAKGSDSDNADLVSEDLVLQSGPNSRSSSRPSSGSRRRRRPRSSNTARVTKLRGPSSEEYVTSDDKDSIFSDDTFTQADGTEDGGTFSDRDQTLELTSGDQQLASGARKSGDELSVDPEGVKSKSEAESVVELTMAERERALVPQLVTFFESRMTRSDDDRRRDVSRGRGSRGRGRAASDTVDGRHQRELSVSSLHSDDGNTSATEGTQTESCSPSLGKAPMSLLCAGVPVSENGVFHEVCGAQNVQEVSGVRAGLRRSWSLSVTPTDAWQNQAGADTEELQGMASLGPKVRKVDFEPSPEKRQRQDRLSDLHSKYGLEDDLEQVVDDDGVISRESLHKEARSSHMDSDGKLRFEVTIKQDETNVRYNVEKTEYKTYALRDSDDAAADQQAMSTIPDTININLTETTTLRHEDRFESLTKEHVIFDAKDQDHEQKSTDDVIILQKTFSGSHVMDFEQECKDGQISRESSVERHLTDEDFASRFFAEGSAGGVTEEEPARGGKHQRKIHKGQKGTSSALPGDQTVSAPPHQDRRYSDSSSSGPRSSYPGDFTYDSDIPADSGITEASTSECMTSQDEDSTDYTDSTEKPMSLATPYVSSLSMVSDLQTDANQVSSSEMRLEDLPLLHHGGADQLQMASSVDLPFSALQAFDCTVLPASSSLTDITVHLPDAPDQTVGTANVIQTALGSESYLPISPNSSFSVNIHSPEEGLLTVNGSSQYHMPSCREDFRPSIPETSSEVEINKKEVSEILTEELRHDNDLEIPVETPLSVIQNKVLDLSPESPVKDGIASCREEAVLQHANSASLECTSAEIVTSPVSVTPMVNVVMPAGKEPTTIPGTSLQVEVFLKPEELQTNCSAQQNISSPLTQPDYKTCAEGFQATVKDSSLVSKIPNTLTQSPETHTQSPEGSLLSGSSHSTSALVTAEASLPSEVLYLSPESGGCTSITSGSDIKTDAFRLLAESAFSSNEKDVESSVPQSDILSVQSVNLTSSSPVGESVELTSFPSAGESQCPIFIPMVDKSLSKTGYDGSKFVINNTIDSVTPDLTETAFNNSKENTENHSAFSEDIDGADIKNDRDKSNSTAENAFIECSKVANFDTIDFHSTSPESFSSENDICSSPIKKCPSKTERETISTVEKGVMFVPSSFWQNVATEPIQGELKQSDVHMVKDLLTIPNTEWSNFQHEPLFMISNPYVSSPHDGVAFSQQHLQHNPLGQVLDDQKITHESLPFISSVDNKAEKTLAIDSADHQLAPTAGDPHHPCVEEIPVEQVEELLPPGVGQDLESVMVYPDCRDGLLFYSSSQGSQEAYDWVETYREETGIITPQTKPRSKNRKDSEDAAEALVAEVKKKGSKGMDAEDEVFFEETVTVSSQPQNWLIGDLMHSKLSEGSALSPASDHSSFNTDISASFQLGVSTNNQSPRTSLDALTGPAETLNFPGLSTSTEDSFYTADNMMLSRGSSDSTNYRSPQQSPGTKKEVVVEGSPASIPKPQICLSPAQARRPQQQQEDAAQVLTAVAAAVGRQLNVTPDKVDAVRELLKHEVECKIASLQRRVRSLSDSAISSDFTEPESTTVSPRNSRVPFSDHKGEIGWSDLPNRHPIFLQQNQQSNANREKGLDDSGNIHDDHWIDSTGPGAVGTSSGPSNEVLSHQHEHSPNYEEKLGTEAQTEILTVQDTVRQMPVSLTMPGLSLLSHTGMQVKGMADYIPEHVLESMMALQESWPLSKVRLQTVSQGKHRRLTKKRSKSLGDISDFAASNNRSDFVSSSLEQAQVFKPVSGSEITPRESTLGQLGVLELKKAFISQNPIGISNNNGENASDQSSCAQSLSSPTKVMMDTFAEAVRKAVECPTPSDEQDLTSAVKEAVIHIAKAGGVPGIPTAEMNSCSRHMSDVTNIDISGKEVTQKASNTASAAHNLPQSLSGLFDINHSQDIPRQLKSPDIDSDSLMSSGELEIAAITRMARKMLGLSTDKQDDHRALEQEQEKESLHVDGIDGDLRVGDRRDKIPDWTQLISPQSDHEPETLEREGHAFLSPAERETHLTMKQKTSDLENAQEIPPLALFSCDKEGLLDMERLSLATFACGEDNLVFKASEAFSDNRPDIPDKKYLAFSEAFSDHSPNVPDRRSFGESEDKQKSEEERPENQLLGEENYRPLTPGDEQLLSDPTPIFDHDGDHCRPLSPGEAILADILARQISAISPDKAYEEKWALHESSPRHYNHEGSRTDRRLSLSDLELPPWTLQCLERAEWMSAENQDKSLTALLTSSESADGGRGKGPLKRKSLSCSSLNVSRPAGDLYGDDFNGPELERRQSIACMEGMAFEESAEEQSSSDSIFLVFMEQQQPEVSSHLWVRAESMTSSEGSEPVLTYSRSTESLPFQRNALPLSEHSASMSNIYTGVAADNGYHKDRLHRSRSASLLDVTASLGEYDDVNDDNIFPSHAYSDDEDDDVVVHNELEDLMPNEEVVEDDAIITNPAFIHRPSLIEPEALHHLFLKSPTKLYTSAPSLMQYKSTDEENEYKDSQPPVLEVVSGHPYFKHHRVGIRPSQAENCAQTDLDSSQYQDIKWTDSNQQQTRQTQNDYQLSTRPLRDHEKTSPSAKTDNDRNQVNTLISEISESEDGQFSSLDAETNTDNAEFAHQWASPIPFSPSSEQWMTLMLQTTQILQNLKETLPRTLAGSPVVDRSGPVLPPQNLLQTCSTQTGDKSDSSISSRMSATQILDSLSRSDTGTQTPKEPEENLYQPVFSNARQKHIVIIKVRDTLTQTTSSLEDLASAAVQTETEQQTDMEVQTETELEMASTQLRAIQPDYRGSLTDVPCVNKNMNCTDEEDAFSGLTNVTCSISEKSNSPESLLGASLQTGTSSQQSPVSQADGSSYHDAPSQSDSSESVPSVMNNANSSVESLQPTLSVTESPERGIETLAKDDLVGQADSSSNSESVGRHRLASERLQITDVLCQTEVFPESPHFDELPSLHFSISSPRSPRLEGRSHFSVDSPQTPRKLLLSKGFSDFSSSAGSEMSEATCQTENVEDKNMEIMTSDGICQTDDLLQLDDAKKIMLPLRLAPSVEDRAVETDSTETGDHDTEAKQDRQALGAGHMVSPARPVSVSTQLSLDSQPRYIAVRDSELSGCKNERHSSFEETVASLSSPTFTDVEHAVRGASRDGIRSQSEHTSRLFSGTEHGKELQPHDLFTQDGQTVWPTLPGFEGHPSDGNGACGDHYLEIDKTFLDKFRTEEPREALALVVTTEEEMNQPVKSCSTLTEVPLQTHHSDDRNSIAGYDETEMCSSSQSCSDYFKHVSDKLTAGSEMMQEANGREGHADYKLAQLSQQTNSSTHPIKFKERLSRQTISKTKNETMQNPLPDHTSSLPLNSLPSVMHPDHCHIVKAVTGNLGDTELGDIRLREINLSPGSIAEDGSQGSGHPGRHSKSRHISSKKRPAIKKFNGRRSTQRDRSKNKMCDYTTDSSHHSASVHRDYSDSLDLSFSDDDLFSSDAHQRAAWRARAGDYGLPSPVQDTDRRSPFTRTFRGSGQQSDLDNPVIASAIMEEIEKLRQEHSRMMQLLERSRQRTSPFIDRARSASPRLTAWSRSSSGESPDTVIADSLPIDIKLETTLPTATETDNMVTVTPPARRHSLTSLTRYDLEENVGSAQQMMSCTSKVSAKATTDVGTMVGPSATQASTLTDSELVALQLHPVASLNVSPLFSTEEKSATLWAEDEANLDSFTKFTHGKNDKNLSNANFEDFPFIAELNGPEQRLSSSRTESQQVYKMASPNKVDASVSASMPQHISSQNVQRSLCDSEQLGYAGGQARTGILSRIASESLPRTSSSSGSGYGKVMALYSNLPQYHQWPSHISTGVEACVDISDDCTQTDVDDDNSSLHLSQLDGSPGSLASSIHSETRHIRTELDRLQQERVEIIEMLSLQYLPTSLTVELLEAKLNYCLGQTDMLLASLERAWATDGSDSEDVHQPERPRHEEYLAQYRSKFEQSRRDLRVCMEEARCVQNGTRGRRMSRTRDVIAMRRRAEIEAFRQERQREQALYERHRKVSPNGSDVSSHTSQEADLGRLLAPQHMTPTQHRQHLISLRKSLVTASSEELDKLRQRSRSSSVSSPASSGQGQSHDSKSHSPVRAADRYSDATVTTSCTTTTVCNPSPSSIPYSTSTSPLRIPRLVLPSSDPSYRSHSSDEAKVLAGSRLPGEEARLAWPAPRSGSSGPSLITVNTPTPTQRLRHDPQHLRPPGPWESRGLTRYDLAAGQEEKGDDSDPDSLDPEKLLRESYAARQLNREQIRKAQEALRLLERHRQGFRASASCTEDRNPSESFDLDTTATSQGAGPDGTPTYNRSRFTTSPGRIGSPIGTAGVTSPSAQRESGARGSVNRDPAFTGGNSYAAYARDFLARSERHIHSLLGRANRPHPAGRFRQGSSGERTSLPPVSALGQRPL